MVSEPTTEGQYLSENIHIVMSAVLCLRQSNIADLAQKQWLSGRKHDIDALLTVEFATIAGWEHYTRVLRITVRPVRSNRVGQGAS